MQNKIQAENTGTEKEIEKQLSQSEIEEKITEMANQGLTPAQIGLELREKFGIRKTKKAFGKRIEQILEERKLRGEIPRDLLNLIKHSVQLHNHLKENKKDMTAKKGYESTVSKIRRLIKYYIKEKKLPSGFAYTPEYAALLVK